MGINLRVFSKREIFSNKGRHRDMLSFSLIAILAAAILVAALSMAPFKVIQRAEAETSYTFCSTGCQYSNLQTAIDSLPSTGGTIYIKDGTYELSNTVLLKSNTNLV